MPADIRADLVLSEREFGGKYKRGKAARLEVLEALENRHVVASLRAEIESRRSLLDQISEAVRANDLGLAQSLATPRTTTESEVVVWLTFLRLGVDGPGFTVDVRQLKTKLFDVLSNDQISVDVFRSLITSTTGQETALSLAQRHGLGRQAVYDRQNRIIERLKVLVDDVEYVTLIRQLRETAVVTQGTKMVAPVAHPLVAVATLDRGIFPSIHDVVATALWAIAHVASGSKKSFRRASDDPRCC